MPTNPFPGMNPFLQQHWSDVHIASIGLICETLSQILPADLSARAEEHVSVTDGGKSRSFRADVAVVESWREGLPPLWTPEGAGGRRRAPEGAGQDLAGAAEPLVFIEEPPVERWIEIREAHGRLVTVIEVLSPANKREDEWLSYRARRRDFFSGGSIWSRST
ncbi:MAG: DUF4058 family protein [Chthoniobacteraceae bacterium]